MRQTDQLTHKHFGRYHAGCYPANLSRPFAQKTVEFGLSLESRGFVHAPTIEAQKLGRYQIEVFPHPATINLFKLDRILKYKKGKLADTGILPVSCGGSNLPEIATSLVAQASCL